MKGLVLQAGDTVVCSGSAESSICEGFSSIGLGLCGRRKTTRQTKEEVGKQHQGMDRPAVRQVPEGSGEQRKMEETGCEIICGAPTTLAVKG